MQGTEFFYFCPNIGGLFMSIVRTVKRENPFVQLDKEYIGNGQLSLKSTGLLTYILSRPDGWKIRMKDIQNKFNDGETSVRSAMKELIQCGYVNRYRERGEDGTFGDWVYDVYERPEFNPDYSPKIENHVLDSPKRDFPHVEKPELEKPELEKPLYSNNDLNNNDLSNNNLNNIVNKDDVNNDKIKKYFINVSNEFFKDFAPGRWSKEQWDIIINSYVSELIEKQKYTQVPEKKWNSYIYNSLKNIAYKHDYKNGKVETLPRPSEGVFYDWLNS